MPEADKYLKSIQPLSKKLAKLYIDSADWFVLKKLFYAAFTEFNNQPAVLLNSKALTGYLTYNAEHDYYRFNDNYYYYTLNQDLYQRKEKRLTHDKLKEFANQANFNIQFDDNLVFNLTAKFEQLDQLYDLAVNLAKFDQNIKHFVNQ